MLVVDIDDTLRDRRTNAPVPGSADLLWRVAAAGVPIVYLTLGRRTIRAYNRRWLARWYPPGRLVDWDGVTDRREFKARALARLRRRHRRPLVCLGDDTYRDAHSYCRRCDAGFILRVLGGHRRPRCGGAGRTVRFRRYDAALARKVWRALWPTRPLLP